MLVAASLADIVNLIFTSDGLYARRFHQTATARGSVSGIDVDMLGVEADRAVVSIACAYNTLPALLAGEVLYIFLKFLCHIFIIISRKSLLPFGLNLI